MSRNGRGNNGNRGGNNTVTCYQLRNGKIENFEGDPCGEANGSDPVPCCHTGDTCLENHFCYFSHTLEGASQFYVASCTDPQHRDSDACTDRCGRLPVVDTVFDPRSNLWACCNATTGSDGGDLQRRCGNPSDETFQAPAPQQLLAAASSSSSLSVSVTATVTPTVTPSSTAAPAAASGISAGAAAGIGVGAGVGGILVLSIIAFFAVRWWRRRKAVERDGATVKPFQPLPQDEPTPMYPGSPGPGFGGAGAGAGAAAWEGAKRHSQAPTAGGVSELAYSGTKKSHASGVSEPNRTSELPAGVPSSPPPLMELDNTEVERGR